MYSNTSQPQLLASVMLYLCAATVGVMSFYMADRKYRTAFLEAHRSLEVKLTLEEQSIQQVDSTHTHIMVNKCINKLTLQRGWKKTNNETHDSQNAFSLVDGMTRLKLDNQNMKRHACKHIHARAVHSIASCCRVATDLNNNNTNVSPRRKSSYCPSSPSTSLMRCCSA